jgi:DNA polymerase III sliding clamp (beta) subunit (PCNA family)
MFLDLLKTIEEKTVEISVNMQNNIMQITSADDDFIINGISASEYVALPELVNTTNVNMETQTFIN